MKKVLKGKDLSGHLNLHEKASKKSEASKVDLLSGEGGILNKQVLDAKDRAKSVIDDARLEAEKIRAEARDILSQVKAEMEKSKKQGFQKGYEEGLSSVTEKIMSFEKMKEEFYEGAEENIIKLVMMVAEKVIGKIVLEHSQAIKSIVMQALEKSLGEKITIKLSPEDYKTIMVSESEFKELLDKTKRINFKEDDSISQGGCVVETEVGTIDARLETQLKAIRKALEL